MDSGDHPMADVMDDPETAAVYIAAVPIHGETMGQSFSPNEPYTYDQNVALTGASLLDGLQRAKAIDDSVSVSDFLDDVMEDVKIRNKQK